MENVVHVFVLAIFHHFLVPMYCPRVCFDQLFSLQVPSLLIIYKVHCRCLFLRTKIHLENCVSCIIFVYNLMSDFSFMKSISIFSWNCLHLLLVPRLSITWSKSSLYIFLGQFIPGIACVFSSLTSVFSHFTNWNNKSWASQSHVGFYKVQ